MSGFGLVTALIAQLRAEAAQGKPGADTELRLVLKHKQDCDAGLVETPDSPVFQRCREWNEQARKRRTGVRVKKNEKQI